MCGTPTYIAPQLVRGEAYTEKCDVYSLGVILYEVGMGERLGAERDGAALRAIAEARALFNEERPWPVLLRGMLADAEKERWDSGRCSESTAFDSVPDALGGEAFAARPMTVNPYALFASPVVVDDVLRELKKYAATLEYQVVPTVHAARKYLLTLDAPHPVQALQFAAKVFESAVFDLSEIEQILDGSGYRAALQAPYELALLEAINFDPLFLL